MKIIFLRKQPFKVSVVVLQEHSKWGNKENLLSLSKNSVALEPCLLSKCPSSNWTWQRLHTQWDGSVRWDPLCSAPKWCGIPPGGAGHWHSSSPHSLGFRDYICGDCGQVVRDTYPLPNLTGSGMSPPSTAGQNPWSPGSLWSSTLTRQGSKPGGERSHQNKISL